MRTIGEILSAAYVERMLGENGVIERTTTPVGGAQIQMYSPDGQHWFSSKSDILRWQKAKATELTAMRTKFRNDPTLTGFKKSKEH